MKSIPLRTLPDPRYLDDPQQSIDYANVLRDVVRQPLDRQKGVDITEMRRSLRVLDAIDAANGTLDLEDADYEHLKAKLDRMGWNVVDARLMQLIDDVSNA